MNIKNSIKHGLIGAILLFVSVYAIMLISFPFLMIMLWKVLPIFNFIFTIEIFRMALSFGLIGLIIGAIYGGTS